MNGAFAEAQSNEVEALRAIYLDDFRDLPPLGQTVWNKDPPPRFAIKLKPSSEYADSPIFVELTIAFTASYPKSLPNIVVSAHSSLHPRQLEAVKKQVDATAKELLGQEMVFEITSNLQALLDDFARMDETPSLEQDRLSRAEEKQKQKEAAAAVAQREAEQQELRRKKRLEEAVLAELEPAIAAKPEPEHSIVADEHVIAFDRTLKVRRPDGSIAQFQRAVKGYSVDVCPFGRAHVVFPTVSDDDEPLVLLHTYVDLVSEIWDGNEGRQCLQRLETELTAALNAPHHPHLAQLVEYTLRRAPVQTNQRRGWQITLLTLHSTLGTIEDLLETVGSLDVKLTRAWSIQILEALESLHRHGQIHGSLRPTNVVVHKRRETGEKAVTLTHAGYGHRVEWMISCDKRKSFCDSSRRPSNNSVWEPMPMSERSKKTDVWQFGTLVLQMLLGPCSGDLAPLDLVLRQDWPVAVTQFLKPIFKQGAQQRPTAFELLTAQFLRQDDNNETVSGSGAARRLRTSSVSLARADFASHSGAQSRYTTDFDEIVVLGRGGFGQVVKARNKLDGRVYAVKKIQATTQTLGHILQEVALLSRLNHSNVVRYYTVWLETTSGGQGSDYSNSDDEVAVSVSSSISRTFSRTVSFSSSLRQPAQPQDLNFVQFEASSGDMATFADPETTTGLDTGPPSFSVPPQPVSSKSTLYIQMEYCENHTLADLIRDGLHQSSSEYWRLFRQILDALSYIHSDGIIHRDLKPKNIFIDENRNVKIGDFGLARSVGSQAPVLGSSEDLQSTEEMTTGVGTSLYVAPEIASRNAGRATYNEKVDMYSLGIIFFEMCCPMETKMERVASIQALRLSPPRLPPQLLHTRKFSLEQGVITQLLDHNPAARPSAQQLLEPGRIPSSGEDLALQEALKTLLAASQSTSSETVRQVCNALFSQPLLSPQLVLYDRKRPCASLSELLLENETFSRVRQIFDLHGAVEDRTSRPKMLPKSALYPEHEVVELIDRQGNILQLPRDMTLPLARRLAEQGPDEFAKTYTAGTVFWSSITSKSPGKYPNSCGQISYDMVGSDETVNALAADAETIQVMVEAALALPGFSNENLSVLINHTDILRALLDFAGVQPPHHLIALSLIGETGVGPVSQADRNNVLTQSAIAATSVDLLEQLAFKELLNPGSESLLATKIGEALAQQLKKARMYVRAICDAVQRLGVRVPLYFAPLANHRPQFYESQIMFQLVHNTGSEEIPISFGGRYDSLVRSFRHSVLDSKTPIARAVGFTMDIDRCVAIFSKLPKSVLLQQGFLRPRCVCLVTSFSEQSFSSACQKIVNQLRNSGISADIVRHLHSTDELMKRAEREGVRAVVVVKQHHASSQQSRARPLRVKRAGKGEDGMAFPDVDLAVDELVPFLLAISSESHISQQPVPIHHIQEQTTPNSNTTNQGSESIGDPERLVVYGEQSKGRGGKKNKWVVEESANEARQTYLSKLASATLVCVDLRDDVLNAITEVSPHNQDEWKRRVAPLSNNQKAYIMNLQSKISTEASRNQFLLLYSTKTENVVLYDTGA